MSLPSIAPHEPCVACLKGDTTTGLAFVGNPEWQTAGLVRLGLPIEEAMETVEHARNRGDIDDDVMLVRACRECAAKCGFPVAVLKAGGALPSVRQP